MSGEYPDAEIDKLIETFTMSGFQGKQTILNGELIDNDIRLSEQIRETVDEVRHIAKQGNTRSMEIEKRKFLAKYMEVAELLGVSLTVEHLLPALLDIVSVDMIHRCYSSNKTRVQKIKGTLN